MTLFELFARKPKQDRTSISPFEFNKEGKGGFVLVLRYAGCNLRCPLCYAWRYAWFPQREGYRYSLGDVMNAIEKLYSISLQKKINWVRVQGGEPCLSLERTLLTLKICGKALQVIHEAGLNNYPCIRAIIQTNGIFFSDISNKEKLTNIIKDELMKSLSVTNKGRIIFELSFKDPTGKRKQNSIEVLKSQIIGFKTLLDRVIKPLWDEGFENTALYVVAGLGPSIDFHNVSIIPIDPYSLPQEYPLFHPRTWSKEFRSTYKMFIESIVPQYGAYRDFRNNPNTCNGKKIPLEEFEPSRFQVAWLSGYAGKYHEYGLRVDNDVPSLSKVLRRLSEQLDPQWIGLCKSRKDFIREDWMRVLKSIPVARNSDMLKELVEEMNKYFYPSHPKGHYPYL